MRMSLMAKLVAAFTAIAVIVGAVSVYNMIESNKVAVHYEQEAIRLYKNHVRLAAIESRIKDETANVRGYVLMQTSDYLDAYRKSDTELQKMLNDVLSTTTHPESEAKLKTVLSLREAYNKTLEQVFTLVQQGKGQEARSMGTVEADRVSAQMTQLIEGLAKVYGDAADRGGTEARAMAAKARLTGISALAAGLLLAGVVGIFLARYVSRPIVRTANLARQVASGQLQVDPLDERAKDEVGDLARAFNQMVRSLRTLVSDMTESAHSVTAASETLAQTAEQASRASDQTAYAIQTIAGGASKQATTTADVTGTVEQLQHAIDQVARGAAQTSQDVQEAFLTLNRIVQEVDALNSNAETVASGSLRAAQTAKAGSDVVTQSAQGMARIKAAVDASSVRIQQLAQLSRQIGEISEVISSIADQTNLLALNAAIEAARAGEHGRGFAVVAEEVRKLAEHSSKSAKEIGGLIGSIQTGTAEAVQAMDMGISEVNSGHRLADEAGRALTEILAVVEHTAHDVESMAKAVREIQQASRKVTVAFESVASVTEENTAATEEMAASAEQVTASLGGIAAISQENAGAAADVSASSEELTASAQEVAASATHLREIATGLQAQISQFRI